MIEQFETKRQRIEALKFPFRKHSIRILKSCPYKNMIKAEYLKYSRDDSDSEVKKKYNALDALSMGYLRYQFYIESGVPKSKLTRRKQRRQSYGRRWK